MDYYTLDNRMTPAAARRRGPSRPGAPPRLHAGARLGHRSRRRACMFRMAVEDPAQFTADAFKLALLLPRHQGERRSRVAPQVPDRHRRLCRRAREAAQARARSAHHHCRARPRAAVCWLRASPCPWPKTSPSSTRPARTCTPSCCCACWARLYGTDGSFEEGARVVRQFLVDAGVDDNDFFLYDGSGMSPTDKISPRAFTRLLVVRVASAVGRGLARNAAHRRRGRHARQPLQELAAQRQDVGQNRHVGRGERALRLPDRGQRPHGGLLHPRQRPLPRQRRRAAGHRPHRRSHCRGGVRADCHGSRSASPLQNQEHSPNAHATPRNARYHGRQMLLRNFLMVSTLSTIAFGLAGCRQLPPSKPSSEWTPQEARGAAVYQAKCARCHYPTSTQPLHGPGLQALTKLKAMPSARRLPTSA